MVPAAPTAIITEVVHMAGGVMIATIVVGSDAALAITGGPAQSLDRYNRHMQRKRTHAILQPP